MKKVYYFVLSISVIICLCFIVLFVNERNKNNIGNKCNNTIILKEDTDNERYPIIQYDLRTISFNNMQLGDSSSGSTVIMDSSYRDKNGVQVKDDDEGKITAFHTIEDFNKVIYNNTELTTLNNIISVLGQYSTKEINYNKENEDYNYIYNQYEKKSSYELTRYTLTIHCNDKLEITSITLDSDNIYVVG